MKIKCVEWFEPDDDMSEGAKFFYSSWKPFRSDLERLVEKHLAEITELFDFIYRFGKGSDIISVNFKLGELDDEDFEIELFNMSLDKITWIGWLKTMSGEGIGVFYFESEQGEVEKNEKNNDATSEKSA